MLLRGRLTSPSASLWPSPTRPVESRQGRSYGPGPSGFPYLTAARKRRVHVPSAANSDDVTESPPTLRRPISELHRSMRILWKPFGFLRRLLQVECCHPNELISVSVLTRRTLVTRLRKAPSIFWLGQRQGFSTMPEIEANMRDTELFSPPSDVRGMTTLDRTAFKKTVSIPVLKVRKEVVNRLMRALKRVALQRPGVKRVIEDPEDGDSRLIMLDPYKMLTVDSFEKAEFAVLEELDVNPQLSEYNLELTYENFKSEEVLRAVLPEGQDVTSGFSRVGHIAHLNLRDHQLPFKHLIGQVMIDKNPGITSAVNKTSNIDNTYRNFQMEVLSGEENMLTKVRENNYTYEFDFSKVYWNPRLSTEHGRITELLSPGDVLFDVFAGVGPFAIPAARKNCTVFANDLNPESHKWLLHNCKLNKVDQKVKVFNMDGKDFLQGPVREELMLRLRLPTKEKPSIHIVMNLPAKAIEFLSVFKSLLDGQPCSSECLPTVHCYCFSKDANPAKDVCQQAGAMLGISLEASSSVHFVRNVAPNKEMLCITFQIPAATLYKNPALTGENYEEPSLKRQRIDDSFLEPRITSNS